jgi:hypothetical protein
MSRTLLGLNGLLAIASALFAIQIGRTYLAPRLSAAVPPRKPAATGSGAPAPGAASPADVRPGVTSYAMIAAKNLFHPARSDSESSAAVMPVGPKPFLHGVVLRDDGSIAYLEDPASKRVAGYRVGDTIAGATIQAITADRVMLKRVDGSVDVRLRDPAKPRPVAAEPPAPGQPAATPHAPAAAARPQPPPAAVASPAPGAPVVPPTLLRRLPAPPTPRDATRP